MKSKKIYLLLGPKGSGKSFIGTLFQEHFGIPFIRVEDWAKAIKKDRDVHDDDYVKEVFKVIENGIRNELHSKDQLVFESTGLTYHFDKMLVNLQSDFEVITIKINAEPETCLHRVRTRDKSIHIDVSDGELNEINAAVLAKTLSVDFEINNENQTETELLNFIRVILKHN